ncbi:MAG: S41 family peptidase [Thermoanaerobaculia bacterium]
MLVNATGRGNRHHPLAAWGLATLLGGALPMAALTAAPPACGCAEEFDSLVQKVEADYIGFHLGLPTLDRARYEASKTAIRRAAAAASDEDCFQTLRPYVTQFRDGHHFLSEQLELSAEEQARLAAAAETLPWTKESVRSYLDGNAGHLDPVEGIWYSDSGRFGVVRERQSPRRDFVAIVLSGGGDAWKPGQVKAELVRRADGSFDVRYFYGDHSLHHLEGTIYKGVLLRMAPAVWGKAYPVRPTDAGLLDARNPRNPTIKPLDGGAWVVSMPSHDGPYREPLERLITEHLDQLRASPLIIVDLRGNEGGGAQTSDPLAPFYESAKTQPRRTYSGQEAVVSSPDQIAYFQRLVGGMQPGSAWDKRFKALVERMQREPGKVVVADVWGNPPEPPPPHPPAYPRPEHFAILIDRGAVSAAEAFVLTAWKSDRVTIFGDRSGGSIDYQSVSIVPLACRSHGLMLGYPTMAGPEHLPAGGFNAEGIPPDVRIGPEVADAIQFIVDYYAKGSNRPSSKGGAR